MVLGLVLIAAGITVIALAYLSDALRASQRRVERERVRQIRARAFNAK